MPTASRSHLVLIPSYNTGAKVLETVNEARKLWKPVWVIVDGSTDGSGEALLKRQENDPGLRVLVLPRNAGKGAAVLHGLREAVAAGFTHVLTMDADGQHPATKLPAFMSASQRAPDAMILGRPVFDLDAPRLRVGGRKISNWWANLETLWAGIDDSLFGLRVYPARALLDIMSTSRWMRRFDFDVEAAVRMVWSGIRPINIDAPVRYFLPEHGGVSHFKYVRDNALLTWMHMRLLAGFIVRLPSLVWRRLSQARRSQDEHQA
jgi:glycosyltransferase involved in cell wall biosynthesis